MISPGARVLGTDYAMECAIDAYGEADRDNVARMVDQVADSLERRDIESALVYGTRLLSMGELAKLIQQLEDADVAA